jgi:magnesium-transporting ATPase (P-type)
MDEVDSTTQSAPVVYETSPKTHTPDDQIRRQRFIVLGLVATVVILVILVIVAFLYLKNENTPTEQIRDIMIIFMAFEFMVLGLAMVILIIQLATLINLFQNEIRPILESSNETANTLRGTAAFLSDNLVEPVIKMNEYLYGLYRLFELIGIRKR